MECRSYFFCRKEEDVTEAGYQAQLIRKLKRSFPGCVILKNDSSYIQGIPDLTLLWRQHWATLEVKMADDSPRQANQEYYVRQMNDMSFSAFICPDNEREVLIALQEAFAS
jgi:hypothetical protein